VVARALASSPRQLQRAYAEIGQTTFAADLRSVRLRNAAELLAHQPLTVTDIARLVGYRQPSHFVKAFRRRYGRTPGAFRDAARRRAAVDAGTREPVDRRTRPSPSPAGDRMPGRAQPRPAAGRSRPPRHTPALRGYSNPNSCADFDVGGVADGVLDDPGDADDVAREDVVAALAARAETDDERVEDDEPADPDPPSKPNSLLACAADDPCDLGPARPRDPEDLVDGCRTV